MALGTMVASAEKCFKIIGLRMRFLVGNGQISAGRQRNMGIPQEICHQANASDQTMPNLVHYFCSSPGRTDDASFFNLYDCSFFGQFLQYRSCSTKKSKKTSAK
jgi:hypothetical protein